MSIWRVRSTSKLLCGCVEAAATFSEEGAALTPLAVGVGEPATPGRGGCGHPWLSQGPRAGGELISDRCFEGKIPSSRGLPDAVPCSGG